MGGHTTKTRARRFVFAALGIALTCAAVDARAELSQINIARQFGISYLGLVLMEHDKILEKNAEKAGLGDIKVNWSQLGSGAAMNDALLSGNLQIASGGIAPFLVLWSKLKGTKNEVRAIGAKSSSIAFLDTRNPKVRTIKDFTSEDRIALAAVKVSSVAVVLQMAAEKAFGEGQYARLDRLTVSMAPPDALAAMLSGATEVTANFTFPPYHYRLAAAPGMHTLFNSDDIVGKGTTLDLLYTTTKFRTENPKLYAAFVSSYKEAIDLIYKDKRRAAQALLQLASFKSTVDEIVEQIDDPTLKFTLVPRNNMKFAEFMYRVGVIEHKPESWKDLFFSEIHDLPGS